MTQTPNDTEPEDQPLTAGERRKLRDMMMRDARAAWAWSIIRTTALWVSAVVMGVTVGWEFLKRIAKAAIE